MKRVLDLFSCEGGAAAGYERAGYRAYGVDKEGKYVRKGGYVPRDKEVVKALLGIEHEMTWGGLFESLPPAYTEWIGSELSRKSSAERVTLQEQEAI